MIRLSGVDAGDSSTHFNSVNLAWTAFSIYSGLFTTWLFCSLVVHV